MKKIIFLLCAVGMLIGLSACSSKPAENNEEALNTVPVDSSKVDKKSLEDLVSYMKSKTDLSGSKVKMAAEYVGAKEGIKIKTEKGNVEFYIYDMDNLSDDAKTIINSIKEKSSFIMTGGIEVKASSFKEPFLMLCDSYSDKDNLIKIFNEY